MKSKLHSTKAEKARWRAEKERKAKLQRRVEGHLYKGGIGFYAARMFKVARFGLVRR